MSKIFLKTYKPQIEELLRNHEAKSFSDNSLKRLFARKGIEWGIPALGSFNKLLSFMLDEEIVKRHILTNEEGRQKNIYLSGNYDDFTLFAGIKSDAYFTHYSAMFLHQLSLQIPKTYYLNTEHNAEFQSQGLTQKAIDEAFSKEQRKSSRHFTYKNKKLVIVNGKNTGRLGVIQQLNNTQSFYYTDLERTLIDIAIRPVYSGGVFEVLGAYQNAKEKLDPAKLKFYLAKLQYIYPYEKVIGFYLEKSGYDEKVLKMFEKESPYRFYLTYNIKNKEYSPRWDLYFPNGL
ncbi:MAG: hypothetical protein K9G67_09605 [Bacteroidales bacterium]|nr:hypothetical protein [Bacteroidales bacterium]MCF8350550.1 hypothetical protein [Bacteroidales bacterium]MCF8376597.1 hypothetical protein [Bacteroidales bacterium]MCF8401182.1 hypothetical protein [Bacteroidales bacterium]